MKKILKRCSPQVVKDLFILKIEIMNKNGKTYITKMMIGIVEIQANQLTKALRLLMLVLKGSSYDCHQLSSFRV